MLNYDSDALECDLAETYHIYNYKELPLSKVALFSVGLRNDSRIKLKMSDCEYSLDTILLASAVDRLSYLVWSKTDDAQKGKNRPLFIVSKLLKSTEIDDDIVAFNSGEEFERARNKILGKEDI